MRLCRWIQRSRFAIAAAAILFASVGAWAQDYTKTNATGQLEARPAGATKHAVTTHLTTGPEQGMTVVQLPFEFPYYGARVKDFTLTGYGVILPRAVTTPPVNIYHPDWMFNGRSATTLAFPYTTPTSGSDSADGAIAALWDDLSLNDSSNSNQVSTGFLYSWTTGSAPNRHYVVSWEDAKVRVSGQPSAITLQVHLYEGTGRIVFAYSTSGTYGTGASGYACGFDSPIDSRFTCPKSNGNMNSGYPGSDFVFDPLTTTLTGKLQWDKLVVDDTGIGNSVQSGPAIAGYPVELRNGNGFVYATGTTGSDGSFSLTQTGGASPCSLVLLCKNSRCTVSTTAGGAPSVWTVDNMIFLSVANDQLGTRTLGAAADPNGDVRALLNTAFVCEDAYDWCASRTTDTIPPLNVLFDPASTLKTSYALPVGMTPATLRIGSRASGNPDGADDAIITKAYARHVLRSIGASPISSYDDRFDSVIDGQQAFAEAFGYALWAAISGATTAADGVSSSVATVRDLEAPSLTTAGPSVAGSVAGALFDLVDPANETIDTVHGPTVGPDLFFRITDTFGSPADAAGFRQAWIAAGHDATTLTRVYIGHRLISDDADEPNDFAFEAAAFGDIPSIRSGFKLTTFNEDWFSVELPAPAAGLDADIAWTQSADRETASVSIFDGAGSLLATSETVVPPGLVHAGTGPVAAGTYRIRVKPTSGVAIPAYKLQVFTPLVVASAPFPDWTVERPLDTALNVSGGIPPYSVVTAGQWHALRLSLGSSPVYSVSGSPPTVGSFQMDVVVRDSGTPFHAVSRGRTVVINDRVTFDVPEFVGFALERPSSTELRQLGGTAPFLRTVGSGALPDGLSLEPGTFRVIGSATTVGVSTFRLDATDLAGSNANETARAVVCPEGDPKLLLVDLPAGDSACGFFVDAVVGSKVRFSVKTKAGPAKRALSAVVLAPDVTVVQGLKLKSASGSVGCANVPCSQSGRTFVIVSSDAGDATELATSVGVTPPKGAGAKLPDVASSGGRFIEIGALPNAKLTFSASMKKKSGGTVQFLSLVAPDGTMFPTDGLVKTSGTGFKLSAVLPMGGTWGITFGPVGNEDPETVSYSYSVKQPKGAAYSAD